MTTAEDEQRVAFADVWRRRGTGTGYVLGRVAEGDSRLDIADAADFGEFYADNKGDWVNVADLYERFIRESGKEELQWVSCG